MTNILIQQVAQNSPEEVEVQYDNVSETSEKRGTRADIAAMWKMGKTQELVRNFHFVSILGFSMILMASWETILGTAGIGLIDGGTAGMIWTYLIVWIGFLCVNTSMAEMGSMAPTSGGQYHWVSEFAPPRFQKSFSYMIGWLCVLGWQTGAGNTAFLAGTQIQGLIALNIPDYPFKAWHGTLLVFAVSAFNLVFNTFWVKKLPIIEVAILFIHILGFFAVIAVLWATGPIRDVHATFTTFNDYGGWNNTGLATLSGMVTVVLPLLGADGAVHMSEEVRDAAKTIPKIMIWTTLANGAMGFVMLITFCSVIGSIDDALASPTKQPYLYVFYNSTGSVAAASILGALVILMTMFCNLSITATNSRQLFAFARDKGVPFHETFAYVPPKWNVPINAVCVSFAVSCLMSLVNLTSSVALLNIASLSTCAIMASYIVSISCIALKRIRGEPLPPSKFSLGRMGLAMNMASILFLIFVFVFSFFPSGPKPTAAGMNWGCVVLGGTVLFAVGYYFAKGRDVYVGPVEYMRKAD
ncbi:amino acid transporter [Cucurbitaria berberidis CBS 394.84]|uniref:Amino acid transporter n=1 Tax=Cucurbitaria berberidis CBS 394.84 TaxID=1168544 RepID=A0A9P4GGZ2_9PLEO|nr:amino acid transporter [Cucurbitaria berberidis CBS 394.84]KAF1844975.1 amino acid transporter [Cucurbitaria berberidis CBS 394.84]